MSDTIQPPTAPPIQTSAQALAAAGMVEEGLAASIGDAAVQIVQGGGNLEPFADVIARERDRQQAAADRATRIAWENSPEGLRARAAAIRAEEEVEKALDNDARTLLEAQGFDPDDLDVLSRDERINAAGLRQSDEPDPNSLADNLAALTDEQREWLAKGGQL